MRLFYDVAAPTARIIVARSKPPSVVAEKPRAILIAVRGKPAGRTNVFMAARRSNEPGHPEGKMRKLGFCAVAMLIAAASTAVAKTTEVSLQDKQQAACYDDVNKLCKDAMPDVDKVTACMKDKKPMVSAKCAAMWDVKQ